MTTTESETTPENGLNKLRIDLFLKRTGLCKRRSVARKLCDTERVKLNGAKVRASSRVKLGDIIEIGGAGREKKIKILWIPAMVLPKTDRYKAFVELKCENRDKENTQYNLE